MKLTFPNAVLLTPALVAAGCSPHAAREPVRSIAPLPAVTVPASPKSRPPVAAVPPAVSAPALAVPAPSRRHWAAPARGKSVIRVPHLVASPPADFLRAAPGYRVTLAADGLTHPRTLAVAPNGDVFAVGSRTETPGKQPNRVVVYRETRGDGVLRERHVWADNLYLPFGIAFAGGYLYVANTDSVVRWRYQNGDREATDAPEKVIAGIPERGMRQHWTRNILFDRAENRMYLTIGSKENADVEEPLRGTIVAYGMDGGKPTGAPGIVAGGMRNPVGLALHPRTGQLWAVVNERDYLGDDLVPDFLTHVTPNGFYGWPYYFIGTHHDPRLPERPDLRAKTLTPDVLLGSHGAPLGLVFAPDGRSAFVARHGSQNRSRMAGYDIVRVRFDAAGRPSPKYETFVSGWLPDPARTSVYGRPVGLAWAKDGALLIADDWGGRIWRVSHVGGRLQSGFGRSQVPLYFGRECAGWGVICKREFTKVCCNDRQMVYPMGRCIKLKRPLMIGIPAP